MVMKAFLGNLISSVGGGIHRSRFGYVSKDQKKRPRTKLLPASVALVLSLVAGSAAASLPRFTHLWNEGEGIEARTEQDVFLRYGAMTLSPGLTAPSGHWSMKFFPKGSNVRCTTDNFFNYDPVPGVVKTCQFLANCEYVTPENTVSPIEPFGGGTQVPHTIWYGAFDTNGVVDADYGWLLDNDPLHFTSKQLYDGYTCNNATFGRDPWPDHGKHCFKQY
jgi:hypothetical protein